MCPSIPSTGPTTIPPANPWRPMRADDLDRVVAVAAQLHPDYPERRDVLDERRRLCPSGCLILPDARGNPGGYVLSHPGRIASPPALDTYLHTLPEQPDCWYIHDIAILPALRGQGATRDALQIVTGRARQHGLHWLALMATPAARGLWTHLGFTPIADIPPHIAATYGSEACPMRRPLSPGT